MITINSREVPQDKHIIKERFRCPDCGALMSEVERVTESRNIFIWYECTRTDCEGQWLQRKQLVEAG